MPPPPGRVKLRLPRPTKPHEASPSPPKPPTAFQNPATILSSPHTGHTFRTELAQQPPHPYALPHHMNILALRSVTLSLKAGPLFEDVALDMDENDHFGLLGRNGSGKSSFLRLLAGLLESESGAIEPFRPLAVSYLPQNTEFPEGCTIRSFLYGGHATEIRARLRASDIEDHEAATDYFAYFKTGANIANGTSTGTATQSATPTMTGTAAGTSGWEGIMSGTEPVDRLYRGGDRTRENPSSLENRYRAILRELGLTDPEAPLARLSGGERRKAALARALAPGSDLLLLDEPTNHLDLDTIEWLEDRLAARPGALVLVTHDRWFLDSVADSILEIADRRVHRHPGSWTEYQTRRAERMLTLAKAENRRLANLKIELAWLMRGARARATKSERRKREIATMRETLLPPTERRMTFTSAETRIGKKACIFRDTSVHFGDRPILSHFDYELGPGARVGIAGPNGSGKTSLLRLIESSLAPSSGQIELGATVRLSHFRQTSDHIPARITVLDYIREHAEHFTLPGLPTLDATLLLERFGFERDFQNRSASTLSGGELRRLMLVRILAESPNLLLMDEPTNDLDIETIEALEEYLEEFPGTLVVVSHDRLLLDKLAVELLVFEGEGRVEKFKGTHLEWREARKSATGPGTNLQGGGKTSSALSGTERGATRAPLSQGVRTENGDSSGESAQGGDERDAGSTASGRTGSGARKKGLSYKEKKELDSLMPEIEALEVQKAGLETIFQSSSPDPARFAEANRQYEAIVTRIEIATARWEELASRE